ncbi:hypothetical protein FB451DRAFT_1556760 [Mycena latifolia]|nr:hypothetical protein FB451DRAFT_1556760 [Mycena latifolia]
MNVSARVKAYAFTLIAVHRGSISLDGRSWVPVPPACGCLSSRFSSAPCLYLFHALCSPGRISYSFALAPRLSGRRAHAQRACLLRVALRTALAAAPLPPAAHATWWLRGVDTYAAMQSLVSRLSRAFPLDDSHIDRLH